MLEDEFTASTTLLHFQLESPAFADHGDIPTKYTCDGDDVSPPLMWRGYPLHTKSFVLVIEDPDAPDPKSPKMTWIHWVVYNIPGSIRLIKENQVPIGARLGLNSWKNVGYGGPCPPIGRHRYFHRLYSLDTTLTLSDYPTKEDIERSMSGHIIAKAQLVGYYERKN